MRRIFVISLLILWFLPNLADAQRWKRYRRQFVGGVGVTNFLGDLGGGNDIGRDGPMDLDFAATRPAIMVGYRYQINSFFFLRSNLTWGILTGSDEYTDEPSRRGRNLSFRTGIVELNGLAEFYLIQNARGNLYRLRGVKGRSGLSMDLYLFGGLGLMYFNPKAEYQGRYVALQPIGTEGQGLDGGPDKYSRVTFTVPYGIGIGKSIDRFWQVNVELTIRQTFTDYIDDVSGTYYGSQDIYDAKIASGSSEAEAKRAASLSDPNIYHELPNYGYEDQVDLKGEVRGDPSDNDTFMTGMITFSYKMVKRRRSRPKF